MVDLGTRTHLHHRQMKAVAGTMAAVGIVVVEDTPFVEAFDTLSVEAAHTEPAVADHTPFVEADYIPAAAAEIEMVVVHQS